MKISSEAYLVDPQGKIHELTKKDQYGDREWHSNVIARLKGLPSREDIELDFSSPDPFKPRADHERKILDDAAREGWIIGIQDNRELFVRVWIPFTNNRSFAKLRQVIRGLEGTRKNVVVDTQNPPQESIRYTPEHFLKIYKTGIHQLIKPSRVAQIRGLREANASDLIDEFLEAFRARNLITELASQPYKYRWIKEGAAEFSTNSGTSYSVTFYDRVDPNTFELSFRPKGGNYLRTREGDSFRILTTVLEILSDFLDRSPTSLVVFVGADDSQTSLYLRGLKRYSEKFNFKWTRKEFIYVTKKGDLGDS